MKSSKGIVKRRAAMRHPSPDMRVLSHLDARGQARMVDVSEKSITLRKATAQGLVLVSKAAMRLVRQGKLRKGSVEEVARLAGIQAAKRTSEVIPLCHPLTLTHVDIGIRHRRDGFEIMAEVRAEAKTGAEMEALHAVAVAALTIYDMVKAADKGIVISGIRLLGKSGGASGAWGSMA